VVIRWALDDAVSSELINSRLLSAQSTSVARTGRSQSASTTGSHVALVQTERSEQPDPPPTTNMPFLHVFRSARRLMLKRKGPVSINAAWLGAVGGEI
jgi:hypothetical protein